MAPTGPGEEEECEGVPGFQEPGGGEPEARGKWGEGGKEPENGQGGRARADPAQPRRNWTSVRRGVVTHAAPRTEDRAEESAPPSGRAAGASPRLP